MAAKAGAQSGNLRPMHHGSIDKMQAVLSKLQDTIIRRNDVLFRR